MPGYFALAAFAIFASLGLPGLSGFVAEITVFLGSFDGAPAADAASRRSAWS